MQEKVENLEPLAINGVEHAIAISTQAFMAKELENAILGVISILMSL
jgi:hypothetical protein